MALAPPRSPLTPSQRHLLLIDRSALSSAKPLGAKTRGQARRGGRNRQGRITVRHRGGGHKRRYREVDLHRRPAQGRVLGLEHDPNRSAWLARIQGEEDFYILAPQGLAPGDEVSSAPGAPLRPGNSLPLRDLPLGVTLHNLEIQPGRGGQLVRSAGSSALLLHKGRDYARVRLPSGLQPLLPLACRASLGVLANQGLKTQNLGKAGRRRWLGRRPRVRGVAMNPIDHPHGGGEGKTSGGRPSVTPWGRPTKGQATASSTRRRSLRLPT